MHQAQPLQVFSIFGSYVLEGDYVPAARIWSDWQRRCNAAQVERPRQQQSVMAARPCLLAA